MDQKDRNILQKNFDSLLDVMYSSVSPYLISKFVIDTDMHREIDAEPTDRRKMEKLLLVLPTRGEGAFEHFVESLRSSHNWLATTLERDRAHYDNEAINNSKRPNAKGGSEKSEILDHIDKIEKIFQRSFSICKNWMVFARKMKLKASAIHDIRRDMNYNGGLDYAIRTMIENWTELAGSKATLGKLTIFLEEEEVMDVKEKLDELIAQLEHCQIPDR